MEGLYYRNVLTEGYKVALPLSKGVATIPIGTWVIQDSRLFRWPKTANGLVNPNLLFSVEKFKETVRLTREGFGKFGNFGCGPIIIGLEIWEKAQSGVI